MATVVVADSNYQEMEALSLAVSAEGHTVREASDGQEAMEIALREQADLVLLDVALPVFTGYECASMLRNDPDFPRENAIILLSNKDEDVRDVARAGADDCENKRTLLPRMREFLSIHLRDRAGA